MAASPTVLATELPVDQLHTPYDAAELDDPRRLQALADDIGQHGLLNPIDVSARNNVVSGHRRLKACKRLGMASVAARVLGHLADELSELRHVRSCDTQRTRHWLSEAHLLFQFQQRHGGTWERTGQLFGLKPATVSRYKQAMEQPQPVLDAIRSGNLTLTQMLAIKDVEPPSRKLELLARVIADKLSPKDISALVRGRKARRKLVSVKVGPFELLIPPDAGLGELQEMLKTSLAPAVAKGLNLTLGPAELQKLVNAAKA